MHQPEWFLSDNDNFEVGQSVKGLVDAVTHIGLTAIEKKKFDIALEAMGIIIKFAEKDLKNKNRKGLGFSEPRIFEKAFYLAILLKKHKQIAFIPGFKKSVKDIGNSNYSVFVYDDSVKTQADILKNNKSDFTTRSFTFVDYSQVDSDLAPEGKSVGAICCIDYLSEWENLDKTEYKAKKERVAQIFMERLEKIIPGIKNEIEYYEVATSKTVQRYTLNPRGEVYGFAQTPQKAETQEVNSVENLHFASAWAKFGGGFLGAIYNGYFCSVGILRSK